MNEGASGGRSRTFTIEQLIDAGWAQSRIWHKGKVHRDHCADALEALAYELAEELSNLKVTTVVKSPEVLARALQIISPTLPARMIESEPFWDALDETGRALLAERDAEDSEGPSVPIEDF